MTLYIIRRVLMLVPLLWAIATVTFFLMHAVPGGPFDQEKPLSWGTWSRATSACRSAKTVT
jgi:ABC-type microcin C transport system permease subunit YejB